MAPAQTPDETMEIGKRAPSSFVQFITPGVSYVSVIKFGVKWGLLVPVGYSVSISLSFIVFRASMPAWTPRIPSYLPPVG
jgi:hypothetical protein